MGGTSVSVYVDISGQREAVPVNIEGHWIQSACFGVPEEFNGDIKISMDNDNTETKLFAIDNVQLLDTTKCTGM